MAYKRKHRDSFDQHRPSQDNFDGYRLFIGAKKDDRDPGTGRMDIAFGRDGDDRLSGQGMDDDLLGGKGDDQLTGAAGMDHLDGGRGNDRLLGGAEADALRGDDGNDYLDEGAGHGDLEGGKGNDTLVGGLGADAFVVDRDSGHDVIKDFVPGRGMFDHLALRGIMPEELRFKDTDKGVLISWAEGKGSVLLEGVFKNDLAQNDFMFTDDRYLLQPTSADASRLSGVSFAKDEGGDFSAPRSGRNDGGDDAFRFDEFHVKTGTSHGDTFQGTSKRDFYFGLGGDDKLYGADGDDDLAGDAGNDILEGGAGMDHLKGGAGGDKLYGGAQADNLMGEDGSDYLSAGAGHDMLEGGRGDDRLHGGDGADAFIVAPDSGNDVVVGGFDAGPGAFDHVAFRDILPNQVKVENGVRDGAGGVRVSWDVSGDGRADGSIFLAGLSESRMSQDDFMFDAVEGGAFVNDPAISLEGTRPLFQGAAEHWYLLA